MIVLEAKGNQVLQVNPDNSRIEYARCDQPQKAIALMYKGWKLNDQRHYTASARCFFAAEQLPGFAWSEEREQ
jgi:hypothetical protein